MRLSTKMAAVREGRTPAVPEVGPPGPPSPSPAAPVGRRTGAPTCAAPS